MARLPDDTSELVIALPSDQTPIPPARKREESADAAALRRAYRHGLRGRPHFPAWTFAEAEAELRAGWILNGETACWKEVRDMVKQGFDGDAEVPGHHAG